MSDDVNPTFELAESPDELVDSVPEFGGADDFPAAPLGMSEFEGGFPGDDSADSADQDVNGGSGSDADDYMSSAMGDEPSSSADEPATDSSADPSDSPADEQDETFKTEESTEDGAPAGEGAPSNQGESDPDQTPAGSGDDQDPAAPADAQPGDLTVSIDGEDIVVGEPTLDITGDGVADTVVVENEGNVEYYVDTDQDGVADQIIVLDENDGTLVNHEVYDPAAGTWTNVTSDSTDSSN